MSLPFYQKHHKHYDRGYRSTEVQSALSQYHLDEQSSTTSRSKGSRVALYSDEVLVESSSKLSPRPKRPKQTYTALDHEIIGYVVPVFRGRREYVSGITDTEEERIKETAGYLARRNLFSSGESVTAISGSTEDTVGEKMFEKKSRKTAMRESAEHINLNKKIHETMEFHRKLNKDSLLHAPEFVIKPRSHTVWEKQNVKLHCTVSGWPEPRVTWYKNNVPIEVEAYPGKYKIESRYSVHSLEIYRCDFDDTAQYRASAMNVKGEVSTISSIVVKRYKEEMDSSSLGTVSVPLSYGLSTTDYGIKFNIHIVEKFAVSFGREGETMSLGCTVIVYPNMKRIQPEIQWYRDGVLLQPSKWVQMHWSGDRATLTLTHLNKEDEGLYTMRVVTKSGYETYSAYVFVRDAEAEVAGAPAAPLDVECLDANKDYVIVTWKQPAVDRGSPILGYFVDRSMPNGLSTTDYGIKFNIHIVEKFAVSFGREGETMSLGCTVIVYPNMKRIQPEIQWYRDGVLLQPSKWVQMHWSGDRATLTLTHLNKEDEGLYTMRVVTKSGYETYSAYVFVRGHPSAPWTGQIIVTEEEPAVTKIHIAIAAGHVLPTRNTDTCVVLTWGESKEAKELIGYYIEAAVVGSGVWEPCNNKPVKGTRFFCHGLSTGQTYVFRVRAVNAAGLSEFSQESEAIEVKAAIGKHEASQPSPDTLLKRDAQVNRDMLPASLESLAPCPNVSKDKEANEGSLPAAPIASKKVDVEQTSKSELEGSTKKDKMKQRKDSASPAPPYGISVLESVHDSMVLGWKQPKFIGGAEITGYFVDYREVIDGVVGKWHEAHIKPISERAYRVNDLKESMTYQFQVRAANIAGVGIPSLPSTPFKCEEWTIAVPGPPYDLRCTEVRKNSLVLLWNPPVYTGRSEVNGFYIDIKEAEADEGQWRSVNEKATQKKYMKIKDLNEGDTYVFRVRAQNRAGVGKPSDETEPVLAETRPGTKEVVVDVDDDGVISLIYECSEMTADSKFDWSKNYEDVSDSSRLAMETKGGRSRVVFKDPAIEDLGIYSCVVTETEGVSASYTLDEDELKRLLQISHDHKFPIVPLKSDLAVELLEKGRVRFWLQAEKLSANAVTNFVFNDTEVIHGEKYKMSVDKNTGIIEMIMEKLEDKDEGTFTFQLKDGKAVNQSSLVLIGDVFKKLQKESEFQRQEWFRKQGFTDVMNGVFKVIAESATELKIQSTEDGIRLYSFVTYYTEELRVSWHHKESKISYTDRVKCGVTGEQLWLQINEPTEKDKGKYAIEIFDGKGGLQKALDVSGQAYDEAYAEFQRLKQAAIAERNRARVVGGLPDVVTIQEGKLIVTQAIGEMCMAMYVADAAGNVLETITTDGKSKPATPASSKKRNKYKATEHVKPRVEEIVATEETPNEELSVTEEKGDVPPE
ncbi:UNVERIFIED_CONTAM: hypothetical protein FKN15_077193 [Acipenser sinensis]